MARLNEPNKRPITTTMYPSFEQILTVGMIECLNLKSLYPTLS